MTTTTTESSIAKPKSNDASVEPDSSIPPTTNADATAKAPKVEFARTIRAVLAERNALDLKTNFTVPNDFPDEVWPSFEEAKRAFEVYCSDVTTCGGGFALVTDSTKNAMTEGAMKGQRKVIRCACHGKSKCKTDKTPGKTTARSNQKIYKTGCNWGFWIERASEGWTRSIFNEYTRKHGFDSHNHKLAETTQQLSQFQRYNISTSRPITNAPASQVTFPMQTMTESVAISDEEQKSLPWHSPIPFEIVDEATGQNIFVQDILEYCANPLLCDSVLRFPSSYTPDHQSGFHQLVADIQAAARVNGVEIVTAWSRNKTTQKTARCCLRCQHGMQSKTGSAPAKAAASDENAAQQNDDTNNGGSSNKKKQPSRKRYFDGFCPFSISIFQDDQSYFIRGGFGTLFHQHHGRSDRKNATTSPSNEAQATSDVQQAVQATSQGTSSKATNDICIDNDEKDSTGISISKGRPPAADVRPSALSTETTCANSILDLAASLHDNQSNRADTVSNSPKHSKAPPVAKGSKANNSPSSQTRTTENAKSSQPAKRALDGKCANDGSNEALCRTSNPAYVELDPKVWEFCKALEGNPMQAQLLEKANRLWDALRVEAQNAHHQTASPTSEDVVGPTTSHEQPNRVAVNKKKSPSNRQPLKKRRKVNHVMYI